MKYMLARSREITPFVGMSFTKKVYHNTTTEFSFLWNKWHHYPEYAHDQRQHSNTKQTAKIIIKKDVKQ
jgi:hypothetical protein